MIDAFAVLRQLVLPMGALPGEPHRVLGPDIPPELVAWGAANTVTFKFVDLWYFDATHYVWDAETDFSGQITRMTGTYDPTNGPYVTNRTLILGAGDIRQRIGSSFLNTFRMLLNVQQTQFSIDNDSEFTIDAVSQGRGYIGRADSAANSAAVGAEAVVLTINGATFRDGRAYAMRINSDITSSVANIGTYQIRIPNLAGTIVAIPWQGPCQVGAANNEGVDKTVYVVRATGAGDTTTNVVLTLAATAGTITAQGGATFVRYFEIEDVGPASLFPNAFQV